MIILTYQDYEKVADKPAFIKAAIEEYKASADYLNAVTGFNYYRRKNEKILSRMSFLEKNFGLKNKITYHKLCNGKFAKFTKQVVFYCIGSGLTLEKSQKKKLGKKFDKKMIEAAIDAFWGRVAWIYPRLVSADKYEMRVFNALESFGLFDEYDGTAKVVVRFWKLDENKPMVVEFFDLYGITKFVTGDKGDLEAKGEVTPYKTKITTDALGQRMEPEDNYPTLPIIPLYANMLHEAEFSDAFKGYADSYDFINSDLVDIITQAEGIYWALKNFGGEDARELVETIQNWKAMTADDDNASAESHVLEAPYQGKQAALASLTADMYDDFMALDTKALTGGSLTNVAINVAKTDLDLKADELEWQVCDAVENIMAIVGIPYEETQFKRRTISNDTETIQNISMQLTDGVIDIEEAVYLTPNVMESRKEDLLKRLALADMGVPPDDTDPDEEPPPAEVIVEDVTE